MTGAPIYNISNSIIIFKRDFQTPVPMNPDYQAAINDLNDLLKKNVPDTKHDNQIFVQSVGVVVRNYGDAELKKILDQHLTVWSSVTTPEKRNNKTRGIIKVLIQDFEIKLKKQKAVESSLQPDSIRVWETAIDHLKMLKDTNDVSSTYAMVTKASEIIAKCNDEILIRAFRKDSKQIPGENIIVEHKRILNAIDDAISELQIKITNEKKTPTISTDPPKVHIPRPTPRKISFAELAIKWFGGPVGFFPILFGVIGAGFMLGLYFGSNKYDKEKIELERKIDEAKVHAAKQLKTIDSLKFDNEDRDRRYQELENEHAKTFKELQEYKRKDAKAPPG